MKIPFVGASYQERSTNLDCQACINLFPVMGESGTAKAPLALYGTPGLRPLVKLLKRYTRAGVPVTKAYRVQVAVNTAQEAEVRSLMLRTLSLGGLHISEIGVTTAETGKVLDLSATVTADIVGEVALEQAVQRLAAEPGLMRVRWEALEDG